MVCAVVCGVSSVNCLRSGDCGLVYRMLLCGVFGVWFVSLLFGV